MAKVSKKFYLDPETDQDLLERLNRLPHGEMSKTVVSALRLYYQNGSETGLDMGELRVMFESILDRKLAGLQLAGQVDQETESPGGVLDRLGDGLLLE